MARFVRFLTSIASNEGWQYEAGQVVRIGKQFTREEIPGEQANAFLRGGQIEEVAAPDDFEAATQVETETAATKPRRTKRAE